MKAIQEKLIVDAVVETLGGFANEHRTAGRRAGLNSVRAKIPLVKFFKGVKSRLDGLHGHVDANLDDETFEALSEFEENTEEDDDAADIDAAIATLKVPTIEELRDTWLPKVIVGWKNVVLTKDFLEFDVDVPPSRKAHAR